MNTPEARRRVLQAFPHLDHDRVWAIRNAFDPLDFAGTEPQRSGKTFRIVHTGSLHTDIGLAQRSARPLRRLLGGTIQDVDFLPRSHVYLLEAVRSLLTAEPELDGVVEVHLAGVFTADDRAVAARFPFVRLHEFVPHDKTIALLCSADLLFLPMHGLPENVRAGLIPHKTYEYIGARRPILAAVPAGDARDLLEASGVAHLCRPDDVSAIAAAVRREVERWRTGAAAPTPRAEILDECSADRLIGQLAAVYRTLIPTRDRRASES